MEGVMLYHKYMKPNSEYYGIPEKDRKNNEYVVENVPEIFTVISPDESVWVHYHVKESTLPDQGWKIHVTTILKDSQEVLKKVAQLCLDRKIEFKHLKDVDSMVKANSKNANRASSGKFITVYPKNNEIFLDLLEEISLILNGFSKGPYILNDKRWKDSNVFYRYGGFKKILNEHGEHCIRDNEGNLIKDERNAFYKVPSFVKDFDNYLNTINKIESTEGEKRLEQYNIEKALSFSNAGGVYLAIRKKDNLKVIIKEARPNAGLDGRGQDALKRQEIEKDALEKLLDIPNVVNIMDYFREWEHYFLVEEFIEGRDLRQWIAQTFPFYNDNSNLNKHIENVKNILGQIFDLVIKMHDKGIAMGDIQPANIMLDDELNVKIIDFETAMLVDYDGNPSLATTGFVSKEMKVGGARDWYALKRLARYLALPVLSSEDLEKYLQYNHLNWIKENYGLDFLEYIIDFQNKCDEKIKNYQEYNPLEIDLSHQKNNSNIFSIIEKLVSGLGNNLTNDERLIKGDIRQYETEEGKLNFLTGGTGAAFTLTKTKSNYKEIDQWIQKFLLNEMHKVEDVGLLTGKAGILALLYERDYKEIVSTEMKNIQSFINKNDISLRSGLAGIGLFIISLYLDTKETEYLDLSIEIEKIIDSNLAKGEPIKVNDWMAVDKGIVDGLTGVSLFYSALYSVTSEQQYLKKAEELINEDLKSAKKDEESGVLQLLDNQNRLLPYISGGSIGVAIAIWFLNHVSGQNLYQEEMNAIYKLAKTRCTISGSLFDGAGGFLLIPTLKKEEKNEGDYEETREILNLVNLFLIEKNGYYVYPGQFSYRLSDDVYTGSSGIILALMGLVKKNPLYWLPLVNSDNFLSKTKYKALTSNHV